MDYTLWYGTDERGLARVHGDVLLRVGSVGQKDFPAHRNRDFYLPVCALFTCDNIFIPFFKKISVWCFSLPTKKLFIYWFMTTVTPVYVWPKLLYCSLFYSLYYQLVACGRTHTGANHNTVVARPERDGGRPDLLGVAPCSEQPKPNGSPCLSGLLSVVAAAAAVVGLQLDCFVQLPVWLSEFAIRARSVLLHHVSTECSSLSENWACRESTILSCCFINVT